MKEQKLSIEEKIDRLIKIYGASLVDSGYNYFNNFEIDFITDRIKYKNYSKVSEKQIKVIDNLYDKYNRIFGDKFENNSKSIRKK